MSNLRRFTCICCSPPRMVYWRAEGALDTPYHEQDHTKAVTVDG